MPNTDRKPPRHAVRFIAVGLTAVTLAAGAITTAGATPPDPPPEAPSSQFCQYVAPGDSGFTDIEGTTFQSYIECLAATGITKGKTATTYEPAGTVTRAEMATFVARLVDTANALEKTSLTDLPAYDGTNRFTDVPAGSTHAESINRLAAAGIVLGGPDGRSADQFGPGLAVTRGQLASFVNRAEKFMTGDGFSTNDDYFTDDNGDVHEADINGIASRGIVVGDGVDTFGPRTSATRGQMAAFLIRELSVMQADGDVGVYGADVTLATPAHVGAEDPGNDGGDRIMVTWDPVDDPGQLLQGYVVYYGTSSPDTKFGNPVSAPADATQAVVTGLTPGTKYVFAVTSRTRAGNESPKSPNASATPQDETPAAVANFQAQGGDGEALLTWTSGAEPDLASYELSRATTQLPGCDPTGLSFTALASVPAGTHRYTDTTAANSTSYCYRIAAKDKGGKTSSAAGAGPVTPGQGKPTIVLDSPEGGQPPVTGEKLHFSAPFDITWTTSDSDDAAVDVTLEYSTDNGFTYKAITTLRGVAVGPGHYPWPEGTQPDVNSSTMKIRATVDDGSDTSQNSSGSFSMDRTPSSPTGFVATPGNGVVHLRWNANPELEVDRYTIWRATVQVTPENDTPDACSNVKPTFLYRAMARTVTTYDDTTVVNTSRAGNDFRYCYEIRAARLATDGFDANDPDRISPPSERTSANPSS
jgi:hypothetical protein